MRIQPHIRRCASRALAITVGLVAMLALATGPAFSDEELPDPSTLDPNAIDPSWLEPGPFFGPSTPEEQFEGERRYEWETMPQNPENPIEPDNYGVQFPTGRDVEPDWRQVPEWMNPIPDASGETMIEPSVPDEPSWEPDPQVPDTDPGFDPAGSSPEPDDPGSEPEDPGSDPSRG